MNVGLSVLELELCVSVLWQHNGVTFQPFHQLG